MNKQTIKPARSGLQVRKPDGHVLASEGEKLSVSAYWRRRESEGDVIIVASPKSKNAKTEKEE
ncbi:Protein of unknown function [Pantoea sesami]|nr:Protein of unknown function [Pantoea sesami]